MTPETAIGYLTGLKLLNPDISGPTLFHTALLIHLLDAVMCRLFAHNGGYPKNLWTLLGLVFGFWAMAFLLLLPGKKKPEG